MKNPQEQENSYHFLENQVIKKIKIMFQFRNSFYTVTSSNKQSHLVSNRIAEKFDFPVLQALFCETDEALILISDEKIYIYSLTMNIILNELEMGISVKGRKLYLD